MNTITKIQNRWVKTNSMAGVGLDPDASKIPQCFWDEAGGSNIAGAYFRFLQCIVDITGPYVVDFKVNSNFFQGVQGRQALSGIFSYIKESLPNAVRVYDGKFADIGNTAEKIADEVFGFIDADAVLLNPYMGYDAIEPFSRWQDKAIILCVNTSNPSANEIQDLRLMSSEPLWKHILKVAMQDWNKHGNIIPVLSATHPENLVGIREIIGQMPIILAGVGVQGGDLDQAIPHCLDDNGFGMMISSSRGIIYSDSPRQAIIDLRDSINTSKQKYYATEGD